MSRKMSRTVECPKCKGFATVVKRTNEWKYVVECENCGTFEILGSEERLARLHYTKRMNEWGKKPNSVLNVPFQIRNKTAKTIKQDLLNGLRIFPIVSKGFEVRFKTVGFTKVVKRSPEGRFTIDAEKIRVDVIANMQWKEASEKYELQEGVEWHCVEGAYNKFTLVRCITDNANTGSVREIFFLKSREIRRS